MPSQVRPIPTVIPLTVPEQADGGWTHAMVIDHLDLTTTTTNTAQVFNVCKVADGDLIEKAALKLHPALKDVSDPAFNTNTVSFGDEDLATRFFSAVQANENGTEVMTSFENTAYGPYTAVKQLTLTVNSQSGKALSDIDTGQIVLLFKLQRPGTIASALTGP